VQRVPLFKRELGMHESFCRTRESEQRTEAALAARRDATRPQREADFQRFAAERLVADGNPARATTQGHILLCYRAWADEQHLVASDRLTAQELAACVLSLPGVRPSRGRNHVKAVVDIVLGVSVNRAWRQENDRFNGPAIVSEELAELKRQELAARPPRPKDEVLYA